MKTASRSWPTADESGPVDDAVAESTRTAPGDIELTPDSANEHCVAGRRLQLVEHGQAFERTLDLLEGDLL